MFWNSLQSKQHDKYSPDIYILIYRLSSLDQISTTPPWKHSHDSALTANIWYLCCWPTWRQLWTFTFFSRLIFREQTWWRRSGGGPPSPEAPATAAISFSSPANTKQTLLNSSSMCRAPVSPKIIVKQLCCPLIKKVYPSISLLTHHMKTVTFMLRHGTLPGHRSNKEVLLMMGTVLKSKWCPYDHVLWIIVEIFKEHLCL